MTTVSRSKLQCRAQEWWLDPRRSCRCELLVPAVVGTSDVTSGQSLKEDWVQVGVVLAMKV